jgi:hypothetical protein
MITKEQYQRLKLIVDRYRYLKMPVPQGMRFMKVSALLKAIKAVVEYERDL